MSFPLGSINVTLDGTGRGSGSIGPMVYGTKWTITRWTTSGDGALQPSLKVWRNFEGADLLDYTYLGNNNASELPQPGVILMSGEKVLWVWQNGSAGAHMTAIIYGSQSR